MKTPREILLARHQAAAPKLDAIRQATVAAACERRILTNCANERRSQTAATIPGRATNLVALLLYCPNKLWQELIWPSRRIWAGLAVVWLLIFSINISLRDGSFITATKSSPSAMMTFREQQRILNELFADRLPKADADRLKSFSPKPRTETTEFFTV